ncbi:MAG: LysR family transcriptional regulator [Deltaproteobacteria bacterium]
MKLRIRSKVWIENGLGRPVIGQGRLEILRAVRETGSINKAAKKVGKPFRWVWSRLKDLENNLGFQILVSGPKGTTLTQEGEDLLRQYASLHRVCRRYVNERFREFFNDRQSGPPH